MGICIKLQGIQTICIAESVSKHLIYILAPGACAADYKLILVDAPDSVHYLLTVALYLSRPGHTAVWLVADLVDNVAVILVLLRHFLEKGDSL